MPLDKEETVGSVNASLESILPDESFNLECKNTVYLLNLEYASERFYAFSPDDIRIKKDDFVIAPTKYGVDIARVCGKAIQNSSPSCEIPTIIRLADEDDIFKLNENKNLEMNAAKVFKEKVKENRLEMKFIASHFLPLESKVIFFFTTDGRVDFRSLVKDLVSTFKMRVELRQIGVRDESRFIGGVAPCGRAFCCQSITDKIDPVSIKMAKDEGMSLNSNRISGHCGRLLCCLSYEHKHYMEINKLIPPYGTKMNYDGSLFKVLEANRITGMVSLASDDGRTIALPIPRIKKINSTWKIV